jgi:S1-C subfamily serine protease
MQNIVIRHLSGTKANQVEEIPLQGFREVLIGREANAQIRYDADREDLVSRNHARIVRDPADPNGFLLTDLDSRNGTFVNHQRIYGASRLQHGDRVQLGPSGPEFSFEVDPPPAARPTRLAEVQQSAPPPTREASFGSPGSGTAVPPGMMPPGTRPGGDAPRPVGRATVERMLGDVTTQMKGESRKTLWTAVIGILIVLLAGAGYFVWNRHQQAVQAEAAKVEQRRLEDAVKDIDAKIAANQNNKAMLADLVAQRNKANADLRAALDKLPPNPTENPKAPVPPGEILTAERIGAGNVQSVILIEATWKITDIGTGGQIYLYHYPNTDQTGAQVCAQYPKSEMLPMFTDDGGKLIPVLSTQPNGGSNTPIVGALSGSGFIVSGDGFFLTNRHVLAPWRATQNVGNFTSKKMGLKWKNNSIVGCLSAADFPSEWLPSEGSKMTVDKIETTAAGTTSTYTARLKATELNTSVQGEALYNVTLAKTMQRYRASSVTLSEKTDIALGKVDLPSGAIPVKMFTDADAIKPGQPVVVMGYPAVSPDVFGVEVSRDMFTTRAHKSPIADPTLTTGPISKVLPSGNSIRGVDGYISSGEVFQLGINTTGAGNSGGPVFDDRGRVIAVFYAGGSLGGASVTFAVPIRFGEELIKNPSVIR